MTTELYSLDGNIGSGKSTLGELIKQIGFTNNKKVIFLQEPVSIWADIKNSENKNVIQCFYENQEKYSFAFQMMAYISRLSMIKNAIKNNPNSIIITERSVYTDKNVFAQMLYEDKLIDEIEFKIYLKWFDEFLEDVPLKGIIYLKTEPETAINRIKKRKRVGEEEIPLHYLIRCNDCHTQWLLKSNNVLTLDGDIIIETENTQDTIDNLTQIRNDLFLEKIKKFISQ
jgi:deoxyadenosine/deoxycytidine kinase